MLINRKEIYNLAFLDSQFFDREGFLLVKDHTATELNYVERFVRLKDNLLFILKIPNQHDSASLVKTDDCRIESLIAYYQRTNCSFESDLIFVLVLTAEFSVRRFDERARNCGFIIEFHHIANDHQNTNVWSFSCLTVEERDRWIQTIYRSNHVNLKSIFNLLLERKLSLIQKHLHNSAHSINKSNSSNDLNQSSSNQSNVGLNKSASIASSLSIISNTSNDSKEFSPISRFSTATSLSTQNNLIHRNCNSAKRGFKSIFLTDSYSKHSKHRNSLEKLTASYSFTLACDLSRYHKFTNNQPAIFIKVFCSLVNGHWSLLGRTETLSICNRVNSEEQCSVWSRFAKKFYLNLYEKIELQNNLQKIVKFDFENNQILLKFNVYNLIEPFTERYILIGSAIDYFAPESNIEIFSSVHYKSLQIGLLKMTTLDNNEFNIFNNHQNGNFCSFFLTELQ